MRSNEHQLPINHWILLLVASFKVSYKYLAPRSRHTNQLFLCIFLHCSMHLLPCSRHCLCTCTLIFLFFCCSTSWHIEDPPLLISWNPPSKHSTSLHSHRLLTKMSPPQKRRHDPNKSSYYDRWQLQAKFCMTVFPWDKSI